MSENLFRGFGIEVELPKSVGEDPLRDAFLKVRETLTRMGIASHQSKTLYQSCHILHKQGHYAILSFKELFALDGKSTNFTEEDKLRRNKIVSLLEEWGLVKVLHPEQIEQKALLNQLKVLPFNQKVEWTCVSKYQIGSKK